MKVSPQELEQKVKGDEASEKPIHKENANEARKVRDRVRKNLMNTIKNLDSIELKDYLGHTLFLGQGLIYYNPDFQDDVDWDIK